MKRTIACKIENLFAPGETAWIISLPEEAVPEGALLLAALNLGRIPQVKFADKPHTALLCAAPEGYRLTIGGNALAVTKTWLEAVIGILMDVYLNGWTHPAHLDQDFGNISITVAVLPPEN